MNIEQQHQYMIAGYKTWTWWSYLTSTFSIFYYGGEHINSQTTSKQVSTRCESTLSCCYLNATFIIRCIHRIFYYYCYFTNNNHDIVLYWPYLLKALKCPMLAAVIMHYLSFFFPVHCRQCAMFFKTTYICSNLDKNSMNFKFSLRVKLASHKLHL